MESGARMSESDAALVGAARCGDREAFALLVERHRGRLTAACRSQLHDGWLAEDAAHEACVAAMLSLDRLRDPSLFGSWIAGIGVNIARRWNRDRVRDAWSWEAMLGGRRVPEPIDSSPSTEDLVEATEAIAAANVVVGSLPDGQRAAVALVYLEGLSLADAAIALGTTPGAVKTRLHKARTRLRAVRGHPEDEEGKNMTDRIEVTVADVRGQPNVGGQQRRYVVVLEDAGGEHAMPIWVGPNEGIALALLHQRVETPRPLTFTFAAKVLDATGSSLRSVHIDQLVGDTFHATVDVSGPRGGAAIDARPSDGISLALATGAPITVAANVFEQCGVPMVDWDPERPAATRGVLPKAPFSLNAGAIVDEIREAREGGRGPDQEAFGRTC